MMTPEESDEETFTIRRNILFSFLSTPVPLNGMGFFQVNHSTMTSVIGAATTYLVVLLQFNISEESSAKKTLNFSVASL